MSGKRVAVLSILLILLILSLGALWQSRSAATGSSSGDDGAARVGTAPASGAQTSTRRAVPPRIDEGPPAQAPIVDEVRVEKREVCQGEENLITVTAHTPGNRDDAYLHAVIGGKPGMSAPINERLQEDGTQPPPRQIIVFGRNGVATTVDIPPYTVKECMVDRKAIVAYRARPNTDGDYDLGVRIMDLAATTPFEPVSYHWEFGDGESGDTDHAWTSHSYEQRDQGETMFADYLIQVTVTSATGETLIGRRSLVLRNIAFSNLVRTGIVTLSTSLNPRFPVIGEDGVVRETVRLWHHRPDPVTIDRVTLRTNYESDRPPTLRDIPVGQLLDRPHIPRSGVTVTVALDTNDDPDVFSIDYLLAGESAEGLPVRGVFPIMTPSKLPTKEDHIPVRDPVLTAKIIRARELLDKKFVTDEEIWALERDGAFDDLVVPGGSATGKPPTYSDMPPHPPRLGEPAGNQTLPAGETLPALGPGNAPGGR